MMYRNRRTSAYIVFECVSENTAIYDHTTKADTYLALGVKELWLIDLDEEIIEIRNADAQDAFCFGKSDFTRKARRRNRKFQKIGKLPSTKFLQNNYPCQ